MSKIDLGMADGKHLHLDIDLLITTRLLIQANSGGGKSFLLRRIAEQAFGKVQVIIVDPEGEFSTLREKHAFALIGKGGESPADIRSAGLVATKLLELNLSAVCDLYEMKPADRIKWTRLFLEAMINAPKDLWHPVLVIIDEAQLFVPEKGSGESEAADAMIALATLGRKRGFCAIWATQRLSLIRKDATSGMLNRLIGPTFEDVDLDRVANLLSVIPSDRRAFFEEMRTLEPGHFYAFGRAVSKKRIMVTVGPVETTHPEVGWSKKKASAPPATPEKIKHLLPKLSDLPKEAEQKTKTEADLRAEISQLQKELRARPQAAPAEQIRVEIPVFKDGELERFEAAVKELNAAGLQFTKVAGEMTTVDLHINRALDKAKQIKAAPGANLSNMPLRKVSGEKLNVASHRKIPLPATQESSPPDGGGETITDPQQRILDSIAWLESVNLYQPKRTVVAFLSEQSPTSSSFGNNIGRLRTLGMVSYPTSDSIELTNDGRIQTRKYEAPITPDEVQQAILSRLPKPQANILQVLIDAYPNGLNRQFVAEQAGQSPTSSSFGNNLGALRSLGVIDYPDSSKAIALPVLFLE